MGNILPNGALKGHKGQYIIATLLVPTCRAVGMIVAINNTSRRPYDKNG